MSMKSGFSWSKELRARAKEKKLGLFAVAVDRTAGRFELWGGMNEARCSLLFMFAHHLYQGEEPRAALEKTIAGMTDVGREMLNQPAKGEPDELKSGGGAES